ncbi:MAG: hypothetical protein Q8P67_04220, partial [archaeon]|nr:hypothetical protein [archaeon]
MSAVRATEARREWEVDEVDAATQQGVSLDEEAELQAEALLWAQEAWRVVEEATAGQASAETQGQEAEARIGGLGLAAVA